MSVTERFRWNGVAPGDAGFHKFRISASVGQNPAASWPSLFLDARSLKDRRIFLLKVFGDHEPNQPTIERRSDASAKPA